MPQSQPSKSLFQRLFGRLWRRPESDFGPRRGAVTHVIILDGTMSSLELGRETNAGIAYGLCREMGSALSINYEPGLQWRDWRSARDVIMGRGINRQIRRAYGYLASRYRPGDRIFLMGYSRGGYAVRSLAGVIERVGLLRAEVATERNIRDVYRHYEAQHLSKAGELFARANCHPEVAIEAIGVWDTVKSLGLNAPLFWRFSQPLHMFHNHDLSRNVKNGFQALALNETRVAYAPVMWTTPEGYAGRLEQVWFPGTHGDVGGQLGGDEAARPLANIPLVWLLSRMEESGLPLPDGWTTRFDQDPAAPSIGRWRGYGKMLVTRRRRLVGADPSERLHESVDQRRAEAAPQPGLLARMQGVISSL